jgi:hypothetical protein
MKCGKLFSALDSSMINLLNFSIATVTIYKPSKMEIRILLEKKYLLTFGILSLVFLLLLLL